MNDSVPIPIIKPPINKYPATYPVVEIDDKFYPATIHLMEATHSYGCYYTIPGEPNEPIHYGFNDLPGSLSLWLFYASGAAVDQLLEANPDIEIVNETKGAYGGVMKTIVVDVAHAEKLCRAYWNRANADGRKRDEQMHNCHYCGSSDVTGLGFFDEPVCPQCGG